MSHITIVEAATQFKVTRSRIYRAIEKGTMTATIDEHGVKHVDIQDMVRVFGNTKNKKTANKPTQTPVYDQNEQIVEILKEQLKQAQDREQFYKQQISDIRKDFDEYKALITYQVPKKSPTPEQTQESEQTHFKQSSQTEQTEQRTERNDTGMTVQKNEEEKINQQMIKPKIKKAGLIGRLARSFFDD